MMLTSTMMLLCMIVILMVVVVSGSSNKKPHGHKGVLEVYNGKPIPFKVTSDQNKKLEKGEAVSLTLLSIFLCIRSLQFSMRNEQKNKNNCTVF